MTQSKHRGTASLQAPKNGIPDVSGASQKVKRAMDHSIMIDQKHWLVPGDMRELLTSLEADYDLISRFLPDTSSIRDGFFVRWICIEDCLATLEKLDRLQETKKKLWGRIPYRSIKHVNGQMKTADYD